MNMWWLLWIILLVPWTGDPWIPEVFHNLIVITEQSSHDTREPVERDHAFKLHYDSSELKTLRYNHDKSNHVLPFHVLRRIRDLKIIKKRWRSSPKSNHHTGGVNHSNLIHVQQSSSDDTFSTKFSTISTINARSLKKSELIVLNHLIDYSVEIACITETWLTSNDEVWISTSALNQHNYTIHPINRGFRGGGIAMIIDSTWQLVKVTDHTSSSAEIGAYQIKKGKHQITIILVYRPPSATSVGHIRS